MIPGIYKHVVFFYISIALSFVAFIFTVAAMGGTNAEVAWTFATREVMGNDIRIYNGLLVFLLDDGNLDSLVRVQYSATSRCDDFAEKGTCEDCESSGEGTLTFLVFAFLAFLVLVPISYNRLLLQLFPDTKPQMLPQIVWKFILHPLTSVIILSWICLCNFLSLVIWGGVCHEALQNDDDLDGYDVSLAAGWALTFLSFIMIIVALVFEILFVPRIDAKSEASDRNDKVEVKKTNQETRDSQVALIQPTVEAEEGKTVQPRIVKPIQVHGVQTMQSATKPTYVHELQTVQPVIVGAPSHQTITGLRQIGNGSVSIDSGIISVINGLPIIVPAGPSLREGKFYYEAKVHVSEVARIGWIIPSQFSTTHAVGDDNGSWGYNGKQHCIFHNGEKVPGSNSEDWMEGDIVGCALDVDTKTMFFFLNGLHVGTSAISGNIDEGLVPAVSLQGNQRIQLCFHDRELRFMPQGYQALAVAAGANFEIVVNAPKTSSSFDQKSEPVLPERRYSHEFPQKESHPDLPQRRHTRGSMSSVGSFPAEMINNNEGEGNESKSGQPPDNEANDRKKTSDEAVEVKEVPLYASNATETV